MATLFPQRPRAHELEHESETFFRSQLPRGWICERPPHDYGVDFRVSIVGNGQVNGRQFVVQIKATERSSSRESETVKLDVSTLRLLREMLEVAIIVKYVAEEKEAYWLFLKDFPSQPSQTQKTITVHLPKANRMSNSCWAKISEHVEAVHKRKLHANAPI